MNILILHPSYYYCIGLSRSLEEKDETVSAYYDTDIKTFDMKGFDVILTSPKMSLVFRRNMNDILLDKTKIIVLEPKILEQHDDEPDNDYYCDGRIHNQKRERKIPSLPHQKGQTVLARISGGYGHIVIPQEQKHSRPSGHKRKNRFHI